MCDVKRKTFCTSRFKQAKATPDRQKSIINNY